MMSTNPTSVLATVNAPYSVQLDGVALAHCLSDIDLAKQFSGQVSSFLGEVSVASQLQFAGAYGISAEQLQAFAKLFGDWSGESYKLAA